MKYFKTLTNICATIVLGAALAASTLAHAQDRKNATVRVGIIRIMNHVPIYVGKKLGFFQEEGIDIKEVFVRSGAEGQSGVIGGSIDLVGVNSASFIFAAAQQLPLSVIADGGHAPTTAPAPYAALIRADSAIKELKDFEGKRIGVGSRKILQEMHLAMLAKKHNVDIGKMKLIEVGFAQMQDALISNQIDVALTLEPFITRAVEDPRLKLFSYFSVEAEPGHAATIWVGANRWLEQNPKVAKGFVRALYRSHEYMNNNPEEAIRLAVEYTGLDEDIIRKSARDILPSDLDPTSLIRQAQFMGELGWISTNVDMNKYIWKE